MDIASYYDNSLSLQLKQLFGVLLALSINWNHVDALPRQQTIKDCQGRELKIKHPKLVLSDILSNNIVLEGDIEQITESSTDLSIKQSKHCPFEMDHSDRDDQRTPRIIPQARCPLNKCHIKCRPIVVRQVYLTRKCHSTVGVKHTIGMKDATIGFIRQRR